MEMMKHHKTRAPDNRLPVNQATTTNMERLVISAAPNRSYLPPDIVEEILDLLPFKSIQRFRSVSKSFFSLLPMPKLLYHPKFSPSNYGIKPSDNRGLFTAVVLSDYSRDVKNHGYMSPELSAGAERLHYFSVGSCKGLVCLAVGNNSKWEMFVVWNPFTSICRKLPYRNCHAYGFGYDSASDDYKVFAARGPLPDHPSGDGAIVEIFSLKTGSWKQMKNPGREYLQYIQWYGDMGLFLNGALHWRPQEVLGNRLKILMTHPYSTIKSMVCS
ncbi:hypothetical protein Tsubulata_020105, partial [Turnera subulata]